MKLSYAQTVTLACVASATLASAFPAKSRIAITTDVAPHASRDVEDNELVARQHTRTKGRGRNRVPSAGSQALAEGAGALGGAVASHIINGARDLTEEDTLLFARSKKHRGHHKGNGKHRGGAKAAAKEGATQVGTEITSNDSTTTTETNGPRDFDEDALYARTRQRAAHLIGTAASAAAPMLAGRDVEDDLLFTRDVEDNLILARNPRRTAHLLGLAASAAAPMLAGRDVEDDLLFTRDVGDDLILARNPRRTAHLLGLAASAAAPMLAGRDVEDDLLFTRDVEDDLILARNPRRTAHLLGLAASAAAPMLAGRDIEDDLLFSREPNHHGAHFGGMAAASSMGSTFGRRDIEDDDQLFARDLELTLEELD
ncbi:hypothetical protein LshimejAT787_0604030 [Lyophyllum shimeji]|uniref:Uncharacterized protein n=1 Tax=Lyophyllum shimeji TaxID=47721 RepID=A0A9P3PPY0_LYOSH|nr:hypothetical protein LshimejAT787_0604030 [Lyophyllum shimeji]